MSILEAAVLGLVQGLTEFLPVSSSGHLVIFQTLFGFTSPPILFDVLLHGATLAAVIYYFWDQIINLSRRLIGVILLATLPAVILGILVGPWLDYLFSSKLLLSFGFLCSAWIIFLSDRSYTAKTSLNRVNFHQALVIGLYQALAILPSLSRSGAAIYAGLKTGLKRESAIAFAFIISIPAILGANLYELIHSYPNPSLPLLPTLIGLLVAFATGLFSLRLLQRLVIQARLSIFGWYCLSLGLITLAWGIIPVISS